MASTGKEPILWFATVTGMAKETISKRLNSAGLEFTPGPKCAKLYETGKGLAAIYGAPQSDQGELMRARVKNLDLDSELKRQKRDLADGLVIPTEIVVRVWSGATNAAKQRLLALPYRVACNCENADFATIQAKTQTLVYEALECIAAFDLRDYYHPAPGEPDDPPPTE